MKNIKNTIESGFKSFGYLIIKLRWTVVVLMLILTAGLISQLPQLIFDTSNESFFHEDDPVLVNYMNLRDQFGRDEMLIIMLQAKEIFDLDFLNKLKELHEDLEENVPLVLDVNSLINARSTKGEEGALIVEDLLEEFPESPQAMADLKSQVMNHPLYQNLLISEDGRSTTITIKTDAYSALGSEETSSDLDEADDFSTDEEAEGKPAYLTDQENGEIVKAFFEVVERHKSDDFKITVAGTPIVTEFLKRTMQQDMKKFTGLAIGSIALFLFILFRRISGTILPLLTVILSLLYAFGLMSFTGTPITMPIMILPSFLLAIGIGAAVHMMAIFYKEYVSHNKEESIVATLEHSGLPIAMTGLTTAAGLLSFSTAEIAPVAHLGIFAASGVIFSLLLTLVFLPALLSILPIKPLTPPVGKKERNRLDRLLLMFGDFATDHPGKVLTGFSIIIVFALWGTTKLEFKHNTLKWFPASSDIYRNTTAIDKTMKGSVSLEIIVDTKKENGLYDPETLKGLEELAKYAMDHEGVPEVGKTFSLVDMIKEIHQALNENDKNYYQIPQDEQLIAQEFLLFENSGSDDLKDIVDSQFSKARITAKVPWGEAHLYTRFIDEIDGKAKEIFGDRAEIITTGMIVLFSLTVDSMMESTKKSYLIAGLVITVMMILLMGSFKIGLLSMIPNLTPIVITMGFMGWTGIALDMFTLLIGSIAIGLAVDDTIHFFHNFGRYYEKSGDSKLAVEETLLSAGRAMLVTTLVLTTGFWLFMFATLNNLFYFGLLTGSTLLLAFLADVLLAPALLTLIKEKR